MPHELTRIRAVVGGGILAVLLLACFGAWSARKNRPIQFSTLISRSP